MSLRLGFKPQAFLLVGWVITEVINDPAIGLFIVFFAEVAPAGGNIFQNRSVSSPAPVTKVYPSGLAAKYNTL